MKTALIATVVLTSLAGAAAAGMVVTTSTRTTKPLVAREAPPGSLPQSSAASAPDQAAAAPPVLSTQSAAASAPVETARPPVPLRISHKRPLPDKPDKKAGSDKKADSDKADADKQESADTPAGQMSQQTAKAAIEADGYKGVQMLNQGGNGVWKASVLRGTTRIVVNVDPAGNVFTE
jgi:hypothetical protein